MSRKRIFLFVSICLIGAMFVFVKSRQAEKTQASVNTDMFQEIDDKALAVQEGQPNAISNLVDTIFLENGITDLNPNLVASLKDRIVRAELNGQTVSESQVVQAVNWLADQFSAPTYARTSPLQTRVLRVELSRYMPNLFVNKDSQGNIGVNKPLNSEISSYAPTTQAVSLLILMIHQKMLNVDFQKESSEWEADFYASQESGTASSYSSEGTQPRFVSGNTQKRREMYQLLLNHNLTESEVERLSQGVLDQLGIPR